MKQIKAFLDIGHEFLLDLRIFGIGQKVIKAGDFEPLQNLFKS